MIIYRCAHCLAMLGLQTEDDAVPACVDHPDGQVELIPDEAAE